MTSSSTGERERKRNRLLPIDRRLFVMALHHATDFDAFDKAVLRARHYYQGGKGISRISAAEWTEAVAPLLDLPLRDLLDPRPHGDGRG